MPERIPEIIQPLLADYAAALQNQLPDLVDACFLHGSLALGAFNPAFSDIDFITVLSRRCSEVEFASLKRIHQDLAARYPQFLLEGSYLQWGDLGRFVDSVQPYPVFHNGHLRPLGHHDLNDVTWWLLKHRGLTLLGPAAQRLDFSVDWNVLFARMHKNLNRYWRRFTYDPRRIVWMYRDDGYSWAVLGVLRQFYSLREGAITSKAGAGAYALEHLPSRWHPLIQEALNIRSGLPGSLYASQLQRTLEAIRFLRKIIRDCNAGFTQAA